MRVGFVTMGLPQPGQKPGGQDVFVSGLASALAGRGHLVSMLSADPVSLPNVHQAASLPAAFNGRHSYAGRLVRSVIAPAWLNFVDWRAFDVVHLHGDDWFFFRRPVPTVRTFYGTAASERSTATQLPRRLHQAMIDKLEPLSSRLATVRVAIGPDSLARFNADILIPCAVADPFFDLNRAERDVPTILFVGTLEGRKRGLWLLELFHKAIKPSIPTAELHMVVDRHADGGPGVSTHVGISLRDLTSLYNSAWVFCLPSKYEGFGLPFAEALAAGLPIVATPSPGAEYVLEEGHYGLISDDDTLPASIVGLLESRERRQEMSQRGIARAEAFRFHRVAGQYEEVYRRAIGAGKAHVR